MPALIDGNKPTQQEVVAHNMKIAKANLASDIAARICSNSGMSLNILDRADCVAKFAIGVAEGIIETYSLMQDGNGKTGGIVS